MGQVVFIGHGVNNGEGFMPHAELRGKLSSTGSNAYDRSEDLLTSDIFGRLRYLDPAHGLLPVLEQAVNRSGDRLKLPAPVGAAPVFAFWPWLGESEPDVLIDWKAEDGSAVNVLVECKHLSGKSGTFTANPDDLEAEVASASTDQLYREYQGLRRREGRGILLYITGHRSAPQADLDATVRAFEAQQESPDGFRAITYWLGWPHVWAAVRDILRRPDLQGWEKLVLADIEALLAHKGYRWFLSISAPPLRPPVLAGTVWYGASPRAYRWSATVPSGPVPMSRPIFYRKEETR